MESLWGELPASKSGNMMSTLSVQLPSFLKSEPLDLDKSHHKCTPNRNQPTKLPAELCRPDFISIHTIQLLKHNRQLRNGTTQLLNMSKGNAERRIPNIPPSPELGSVNETENIQGDGSTMSSALMLDEGTIEIDGTVARQLSRRAVATICAHSGFETCQESALECLTDILHEYNLKFCKRLRLAVDREATYGTTSFQDVLTDVLRDIGIENTQVLYQFWKTRIKDYHDFIERKNNKLRDQYQALINPPGESTSAGTALQVKQETTEALFTDIFPEVVDPQQTTDSSTTMSLQGVKVLQLEEEEEEEEEGAQTSNSMSTEDADAAQWIQGNIKIEASDKDSIEPSSSSADRNSQNEDSLTLGPSPVGSTSFDALSPVSTENARKKRKK